MFKSKIALILGSIALITNSLYATPIEIEKRVVKELIPFTLPVGYKLDLQNDVGLPNEGTNIEYYESNVHSGKSFIDFHFNDGEVIKTPVYGIDTRTKRNYILDFIDIENHWAKDDIIWVYENNIMNGESNSLFGVDRLVRFEEVAVILNKVLMRNNIVTKYNNTRTDIKKRLRDNHWASTHMSNVLGTVMNKAIAYPKFEGSLYGFNITKLDLADMINSYIEQDNSSLDIVDMGSKYSSWKPVVVNIASKGIMGLDSEGKFNPEKEVSRAELAVIIRRFNDYLASK